jgi:mono/diheme cytochrome c family protein
MSPSSVLLAAALFLSLSTAASAQGAAPSGADGRKIYSATCAACHQASAEGVPGQYPPLAGSAWVTSDERRLLRVILHGLVGPVDVEGESYSGAMPAWGATLTDAEIAAVATYLRGAFGNHARPVSVQTVAGLRREHAMRATPWTQEELARDQATATGSAQRSPSKAPRAPTARPASSHRAEKAKPGGHGRP